MIGPFSKTSLGAEYDPRGGLGRSKEALRKGEIHVGMEGWQNDLKLENNQIESGAVHKEEFSKLESTAGRDIPMLEVDPGDLDNKTNKMDLSTSAEDIDPRWMVESLEAMIGYENLEPILGRAVTNKAFREQLVGDPDAALGEYDLSDEELSLLGQISPNQLEQMAEEVRARFDESIDASIQAAQGTLLAELLWGTDPMNE